MTDPDDRSAVRTDQTEKRGYREALEGRYAGSGRRVLVVAARFNPDVTEALLDRAGACLRAHGVDGSDLVVVRVPGSWELPQAVRRGVRRASFDAAIALGCVVRGETPHFEFICSETARGLGAVAADTGVPVIFGVLTTDTHDQALERARPDGQDKGWEAGLAALEMIDVFERLG